ncbi:PfkB family carbohydrate kinase [Sorangium sp. So ce367]|uniref:PfkB family carbohydrate kinase n=1 Tax=Sorangium sp. So ce367 TaxID=3133305 RepID=UPI003F6424EE
MASMFASAGRVAAARVAPSLGATLDVICAGEALWDLAPPGGASLRFRPGGGAVNAAVALARSGLRVGLAAALGDDAPGRALLARVAAAGVDVAGVALIPTRQGLILLEDTGGARHMVAHRAEDELPLSVPEGWAAPVLLLSGISPALAPIAALCRAARAARRTGTVVVVDLNARWRLWAGRDPRVLHALLREADVVRCSAADLAGLGLDDAQVRAAMRPSATLVLTQGAGAARAAGPFGEIALAPPVVAETRAAGAGDAFTAAICAEIARAGDHGPERPDLWTRAIQRGHAAASARVGRR